MAACRQLEQQLGACTRLGEQQLAGCRQPAMAMGQLGPSGKSGMPVRGGLIPIPPGGIGLGEASSSPSRTDTKTSS